MFYKCRQKGISSSSTINCYTFSMYEKSVYSQQPGLSGSDRYPVCLAECTCPPPGEPCHGEAPLSPGPVWLCSLSQDAVCSALQTLCDKQLIKVSLGHHPGRQMCKNSIITAQQLVMFCLQNYYMEIKNVYKKYKFTFLGCLNVLPTSLSCSDCLEKKI